MQPRHITVTKTARYFTAGDFKSDTALIACHGYAQLAADIINDLAPLAEEMLVVAPEGLSRFYTRGFFGKVGATWMTNEDRENEIHDYVNYLQQLYDHIRAESAATRLHILGFSQGCSTVCRWTAVKQPQFEKLFLCSGRIPDDMNWDTFRKITEEKEVYALIGDQDPFIAEKDLENFEKLIAEKQLKVNLQRFQGVHEINISILRSLL